MPRKNDLAEIEITALTNEGSGVGRLEGMAVFVPNTAPGDKILARLTKICGRYAYARAEEIIVPSTDRIASDCPVSVRCGGCSLRHISYAAECRQKARQVADAFERIGGIFTPCSPLLCTGVTEGYRNKAMFPVRRRTHRAEMGFFAARTHDIVNNTDCRLQPPEFNIIASAVRDFINERKISCYDETSGHGLVRHLYLRRAWVTGEIMVCLVINGDRLPEQAAFLAMLSALCLPIASVSLNINRDNTNVILGGQTTLLCGREGITDILCGVSVTLSPASFYQVNHDAAELLYEKAAEYAALSGRETVLDLYCGTGTIGLSMAKDADRLIGVEIVQDAVRDAAKNAAENGITNAEFFCADAAAAAERLAREGTRPDVVIVDPPRKGCDMAVLSAIAEMAPKRIVMISCNPATAARDCKRLLELRYETKEITPVDMFPRTGHCEVIVQLQRENI